MVLGLFSLDKIKSRVRRITGRVSTTQISDAELLEYINEYYCYELPNEIKPFELNATKTVAIPSGTDTLAASYFGLGDDNYVIDAPAYIDDFRLRITLNPEEFYDRWPEAITGITTTTVGRPIDALLYNDEVIFRPVADTDYTMTYDVTLRPQPFTGVGTEYPLDESWGNVIAYGAAKNLLQDAGESEILPHVSAVYMQHANIVMRRFHDQNINQRAKPKY